MKRVDLVPVEHNRKIGEACEYIEPNITEDCIFYDNGEPVGFYLTKMPEKMCKLAEILPPQNRRQCSQEQREQLKQYHSSEDREDLPFYFRFP